MSQVAGVEWVAGVEAQQSPQHNGWLGSKRSGAPSIVQLATNQDPEQLSRNEPQAHRVKGVPVPSVIEQPQNEI